jgi:hypothetical protein
MQAYRIEYRIYRRAQAGESVIEYISFSDAKGNFLKEALKPDKYRKNILSPIFLYHTGQDEECL